MPPPGEKEEGALGTETEAAGHLPWLSSPGYFLFPGLLGIPTETF